MAQMQQSAGMMPQKHWYLVPSKPGQEEIAKINLKRQGYTACLPLCKLFRRRMGRRLAVIGPLFPRLFIQLESGVDDWRPIRSTKGVAALVRFGTEPAVVLQALIGMLMARAGPGGIHTLPDKALQPGERVRIRAGVMEGYEAVLLTKSARDRVILLLDSLGKQSS